VSASSIFLVIAVLSMAVSATCGCLQQFQRHPPRYVLGTSIAGLLVGLGALSVALAGGSF
jgi:hypothetical protein